MSNILHFKMKKVLHFSCFSGSLIDIDVHQQNSVQKYERYGEKTKYILQMCFDTNLTP